MNATPDRNRVYQNAVVDSTKWDRYQRRPDDIIVCSSYKAGTTWMQGICAALIFQQPQPPIPQDKLSPWLDANHVPLEENLALLESLENRRYIKTHCALDGIKFFDDIKYIFVGRDGRDVFMSVWNHWQNLTTEFIDTLNDKPDRQGPPLAHPPKDMSINEGFDLWLSRGVFDWEHDGFPFGSHLHHAQSWWNYRHLPNILFVHYDSLSNDIDSEMRRVAAFLDIPVDESNWSSLLDGVSFSSMKKNASKMAPGGSRGTWKDTSRFFNKGVGKRWKGVLTDEQIARYEQVASERLEPELCHWLAGDMAP